MVVCVLPAPDVAPFDSILCPVESQQQKNLNMRLEWRRRWRLRSLQILHQDCARQFRYGHEPMDCNRDHCSLHSVHAKSELPDLVNIQYR